MEGLALQTAPSGDVVTLDAATSFCNIDDDDTASEALLQDLIIPAVVQLLDGPDGIMNRALLRQTWDMSLHRFPSGSCLLMPLPPLVSVTSISYIDTAGDSQTWSSSNYTVDTSREPGGIFPAFNQSWPATREQANAVTVRFVAGYLEVPAPLRLAVLSLVSHYYQFREPTIIGTVIGEIPDHVDRMLKPWRMRRFDA